MHQPTCSFGHLLYLLLYVIFLYFALNFSCRKMYFFSQSELMFVGEDWKCVGLKARKYNFGELECCSWGFMVMELSLYRDRSLFLRENFCNLLGFFLKNHISRALNFFMQKSFLNFLLSKMSLADSVWESWSINSKFQ